MVRLIDFEALTLTSLVMICLLDYFFKRKERIAREEYDKLEALAQQYKFERDVLEESQQNKVEVVRCENCKFGQEKSKGFFYFCKCLEGLCAFQTVKPTDYCSYGERKEE